MGWPDAYVDRSGKHWIVVTIGWIEPMLSKYRVERRVVSDATKLISPSSVAYLPADTRINDLESPTYNPDALARLSSRRWCRVSRGHTSRSSDRFLSSCASSGLMFFALRDCRSWALLPRSSFGRGRPLSSISPYSRRTVKSCTQKLSRSVPPTSRGEAKKPSVKQVHLHILLPQAIPVFLTQTVSLFQGCVAGVCFLDH